MADGICHVTCHKSKNKTPSMTRCLFDVEDEAAAHPPAVASMVTGRSRSRTAPVASAGGTVHKTCAVRGARHVALPAMSAAHAHPPAARKRTGRRRSRTPPIATAGGGVCKTRTVRRTAHAPPTAAAARAHHRSAHHRQSAHHKSAHHRHRSVHHGSRRRSDTPPADPEWWTTHAARHSGRRGESSRHSGRRGESNIHTSPTADTSESGSGSEEQQPNTHAPPRSHRSGGGGSVIHTPASAETQGMSASERSDIPSEGEKMEIDSGDSSHSSYDASGSESSGSQAGEQIQAL